MVLMGRSGSGVGEGEGTLCWSESKGTGWGGGDCLGGGSIGVEGQIGLWIEGFELGDGSRQRLGVTGMVFDNSLEWEAIGCLTGTCFFLGGCVPSSSCRFLPRSSSRPVPP